MTSSFVGPERFEVVSPARLGTLIGQGWEPAALSLVVWEPDSSQAYLLVQEEIDLLLDRTRRGEHVETILAGFDPVPVIEPGARPQGRAIVVDGDRPTGVWVPTEASGGGGVGGEGGGEEEEASSEEERLEGELGEAPEAEPPHWPGEAPPPAAAAPPAAGPPLPRSATGGAGPTQPSRFRRRLRGLPSLATRRTRRPRDEAQDQETPTGAGEATIRRTPHLDVPDELVKAAGSKFTVSVRVDSRPFESGEEGTDVVIEAPPDVRRVKVGVLLLVSEHFQVEGEEYGSLTIERELPQSASLEFRLRVADEPPDRPAGIQALFLYHGRSCGQVGRQWDWQSLGASAPAAEPEGEAPASLPVHVDAKRPDLSVFITAPVQDGLHFKCAVETPLLPGYEEARSKKFGLPEKAETWVRGKFRWLTDEDLDSEERRYALEEIGQELFDAAPELFREVLWKMIDAGRPPMSIYIASVEPTLPWELMIPNRPPDKKPDVLKPLGVEFAVGRWTRSDSKSPPQLMPIRDSLVVAPVYEGEHALDSGAEVELVTGRLNGTEIKPATRRQVERHCRETPASLLHFVCHGEADVDGDDAIELNDEELMSSSWVRANKAMRSMCAERAPLVFINACETGQLVHSIAGGAGFPFAFATIGARAIVAPLWPVDDDLARSVAEQLYTSALKPGAPPLAEILRRIRERAYVEDDADTFAAYCFYGDPLAKLQLIPAAGDSGSKNEQ
jgi:hypothetical protein